VPMSGFPRFAEPERSGGQFVLYSAQEGTPARFRGGKSTFSEALLDRLDGLADDEVIRWPENMGAISKGIQEGLTESQQQAIAQRMPSNLVSVPVFWTIGWVGNPALKLNRQLAEQLVGAEAAMGDPDRLLEWRTRLWHVTRERSLLPKFREYVRLMNVSM